MVATLGFGAALTAVPARTAGVLGLGPDLRTARALGLLDLALGSGLLLHRRRRARWMAVRAAANLVIAGCYAREVQRSGSPRAKVGGLGMAALTGFDGAVAVALRTAPARSRQARPSVPVGAVVVAAGAARARR
jgi:hypothetical protein